MHIKLANQTQLKLIAHLDVKNNLTPWGYINYCNSFYQTNHYIYVLMHQKQIYGLIVMALNADEMEILQLWVDKHYQGCGYGKMLMQFLLNMGKNKLTRAIYLEVRASNMAAMNLYKSCGFKDVGFRKDYYHHDNCTEDAIIMQYCYE